MPIEMKRRIMRALKINEISAVDRPAQAHATMVIMKRDDRETDPKGVALAKTSPADPGTQPLEDDMADKTAAETSAEITKRDEQIAKLQAVVDLSPAHRAHYDTLSKSRQDDFLTSSDAAKDALIKAADEANPVIFTAADGTEFRKNDDPRMVEMAKRWDADRAEVAKLRLDAEQSTFEKRADEVLGLIPGDKVEKIAIVRRLSQIEDEEVRKKAFDLLEKANKVYKMALSTVGVTETTTPSDMGKASPRQLLDAAIAACAKEDGISIEKATSRVMETPEGQRLYDLDRMAKRGLTVVAQ